MSTNPFHSEELLKSASTYPVAKGDLPGHEFRGNQYQSVAEHAKDLEHDAWAHVDAAKGYNIDDARALVQGHRFLADKLSGSAKGAHTRAANAHAVVNNLIAQGVDRADVRRAATAAANASAKAYDRTPGAIPRYVNGPWGEGDEIYYQGNVPNR